MTRGRALGVLAAACVAVAACAAGVAHAGQYNVFYSAGQGCGLFTATATTGFEVSTCGGPAMTISGGLKYERGLGNVSTEAAYGSAENVFTVAPAGVQIVGATIGYSEQGLLAYSENGWAAGDFNAGGSNQWPSTAGFADPAFSSNEWGFQVTCSASPGCSGASPAPPGEAVGANLSVSSIAFTANDTQTPSVSAADGSLYDQTDGYVWNPPGDPWPIGVSVSDPAGVCGVSATAAGATIAMESALPDQNAWQQCPNGPVAGSLDTTRYVSGAGTLPLSYTASDPTGAPNSTTTATRAIQVDNDPVNVTLATPNDANPTVWVNHAVEVDAGATAGPSGISATTCSIDGAPGFAYPGGGFVVDGDGAHTVTCTASNSALDPQEQHNTGTASEPIDIDEAPPTLAFAPVNPVEPDELAVNTSDAESGVAGGLISVQGPRATAASPVRTSFSGGQLLADFNDGGKNGDYTFTATACDAVGNCANTSEVLHLPIRLGSEGLISFRKIVVPARTLHKRILVGARRETIDRREKVGGRYERVKRTVQVGGRLRHVRVQVRVNRRCGHRRITVRTRRHHHRRRRVVACRKMIPRVVTHRRERLGHRVRLYGRLRTQQGTVLAHVPVIISTRPAERGGRFHRTSVVTTNQHGDWRAKLPGGPSRTIRARYKGAAIMEPATVKAQLTVPAGIRLHIAPHVLPWNRAIHIRGHLVGRYIPHDGVALRLLVRYPGHHAWTPLEALRTTRHGAFNFYWSYHSGRGVARYPFKIATNATETDYPYAAGSSRPVRITFGRATPHHQHRRKRHRARRRHHGS